MSYAKASTGVQISSPLSESDRTLITYHKRPAHVQTIMAHLLRLASHKPVKGLDKSTPDEGSAQTTKILEDIARLLSERKVTELALYFAIAHFLEDDEDPFFPTYAKMKKAVT